MPKNSKSPSPARTNTTLTQTSSETPFEKSNRLKGAATNSGPVSLPKLKRGRSLSVPLFSIGHSGIITCQVIGEMYEGDMSLGDKAYDSKPTLCPIINFDEDGKEGLLICNAVIKSTLEKVVGGYIGKYFQLKDGGPKADKKYRIVEIYEMVMDE